MSLLVAFTFLVILAALAAAGFFMLRSSNQDPDDAKQAAARQSRMAKALTVRIGVSVLLFICILLAWKFGYLQPSGLPLGK